MKKKERAQHAPTQSASAGETPAAIKPAYLLNGKLHPLSADYLPTKPPIVRRFATAKELVQLVLGNIKLLFGQHAFIVPLPKKKGGLGEHVPDFFMLDLGEREKPKVFILDIVLSKQGFMEYLLPRITKFYLNEEENMTAFYQVLDKSKELGSLLKTTKPASILIEKIGTIKPSILVVTDKAFTVIADMSSICPQWQNVKQMTVQKYVSGKDTLCTVLPSYTELFVKGRKLRQSTPLTEEEHLQKASEGIQGIYKRIKAELLSVNHQLLFNPQKYYISLRRHRNLAFFHFSKNNITLVVMNPEKDTRKKIKHFEIKTLTEKVQKFWNGESCSIVLDKTEHLKEVIDLLKKMVVA